MMEAGGAAQGRRLRLVHAHATRYNAGDDAIVLATYQLLHEAFPGVRLEVVDVARDRFAYPDDPVMDFMPLYRFHRPWYWPRLLRRLWSADAVLIGGGDLLAGGIEFLGIGLVAWASGAPLLYFGLGVNLGEASRLNRWYSGLVARRATHLVVRDPQAAEELRAIGVRSDRITMAQDVVFALDLGPATGSPPVAAGPPRLGVSLRAPGSPSYPFDEPERRRVAELLDRIVETKNAEVVLVPFLHPESPYERDVLGHDRHATDLGVLRRCRELMKHSERASVYEGSLHPKDLMNLMRGLDGLLAMRLHASILGLMAGLRPVAIEYSPKIRRVLSPLGLADRVVTFDQLDDPALPELLLPSQRQPPDLSGVSRAARRNIEALVPQISRASPGRRLLGLPLAAAALAFHLLLHLYAHLPPGRRRS